MGGLGQILGCLIHGRYMNMLSCVGSDIRHTRRDGYLAERDPCDWIEEPDYQWELGISVLFNVCELVS